MGWRVGYGHRGPKGLTHELTALLFCDVASHRPHQLGWALSILPLPAGIMNVGTGPALKMFPIKCDRTQS